MFTIKILTNPQISRIGQWTTKKPNLHPFCLDSGEHGKKLIVLIANTQTRPAVCLLQVIALEKRPILISFHVFEGA